MGCGMKKIIYGLLITLALVFANFSFVLAEVNRPPTDTPQPPPTETDVPTVVPPTETKVSPPTNTPIPPTDEPTPSSPPPETQIPPTETVEVPFAEPTPTIEVDPTPTETFEPGVTPTKEKHEKPTPTWDCEKQYDDKKCLPDTGGGLPANISLGLMAIGTVLCVFVILLARRGRHA